MLYGDQWSKELSDDWTLDTTLVEELGPCPSVEV